jgi:pyruvate/2-oxoglutarate dehydrogenase complex dihydrolipoamide dehydrogenase (E3) component
MLMYRQEGTPTKGSEYDALVIGAGQGGVPLCTALAGEGWRTALVEETHVGGTCINEGCTPTKTMVASARAAHIARRAAAYGVRTGHVGIDMEKVRQRKRDIVTSFREGSENRIRNTEGLDLFMGRAEFVDRHGISVVLDEGPPVRLRARHLFIDTGTRPRVPDIPGIGATPYLTSTSIMELDTVPGHLLIIGGGYIGLEFGQMFRRFGSDVTIIHRGAQLLSREDEDIAGAVLAILREDGVEVLLEVKPVEARIHRGSWIEIVIEQGGKKESLTGSHLLVAAGRVPNTGTLHPERAGIELDERDFVRVNERLETNVPGIYALGDVKGGPSFTHISYDDYRILFSNLTGGILRTTADRPVPYTVFIDPQLGRVGLSEREARSKGLSYRVAKLSMNRVARALEMDEPRGLIKALVDPATELILGAAVLGTEGGELMAVLQTAMMGELPFTALRDVIFAHPTLAEALNNLFLSFED